MLSFNESLSIREAQVTGPRCIVQCPTPTCTSSSLTTYCCHEQGISSLTCWFYYHTLWWCDKRPTHLNSPTPFVGIVVARLVELESEKDHWQRIARDWYAQVVADYPVHGKFLHHLGLLSRKAGSEELCSVYHPIKR